MIAEFGMLEQAVLILWIDIKDKKISVLFFVPHYIFQCPIFLFINNLANLLELLQPFL